MSASQTLHTDNFGVIKFHHLEITCGDAVITMKRLKPVLGAVLVARSLHETGNHTYSSYVLNTHDINVVVTAPYLADFKHPDTKMPNPTYDDKGAQQYLERCGTGVSAIGILVRDARVAYKRATKNGARGVLKPHHVFDEDRGVVTFAEVDFYGDQEDSDPKHQSRTIIRFISFPRDPTAQEDSTEDPVDEEEIIDPQDPEFPPYPSDPKPFKGPFLPGYQAVKDEHPYDFGLTNIDHVAGNVYDLDKIVGVVKAVTGFHTFSKFVHEVLHSEVLSNKNEHVLFLFNKPAKELPEIAESLNNHGPGVQYLTLNTNDIVSTVVKMKDTVGEDMFVMTSPSYDDETISKLKNANFTEQNINDIKKHGILIGEDEKGLLLQIFTKPFFDQPTLFLEIIQRKSTKPHSGFGLGNFIKVFKKSAASM